MELVDGNKARGRQGCTRVLTNEPQDPVVVKVDDDRFATLGDRPQQGRLARTTGAFEQDGESSPI
jgi:hypothetical protein